MMERRNAIKNIGRSMGVFVATPAVLELLQSCGGPQYDWTPVFYTAEEGAFVRGLVDTLLPAVDDMPSASAVNVHVFIDKYAKDILDLKQQAEHQMQMRKAIESLLASSGKSGVNKVDTASYEAWMDELFGGSSDDEVYKFMVAFRSQTIWAYKNSEQVGETIMAYNPIPGKYEGCVDLEGTTQGKAWSI
ncbi:MAG: gluconate 2-dehydrogenase subunit 3 family protein [Cyclobacteriaceae bacterium]